MGQAFGACPGAKRRSVTATSSGSTDRAGSWSAGSRNGESGGRPSVTSSRGGTVADSKRLVLVREPLWPDFGLNLVDSRDDTVLAWAPTATAIPVAERINQAYPDRDLAPDPEAL